MNKVTTELLNGLNNDLLEVRKSMTHVHLLWMIGVALGFALLIGT